jgi:hypothetical protein
VGTNNPSIHLGRVVGKAAFNSLIMYWALIANAQGNGCCAALLRIAILFAALGCCSRSLSR